MEQEIEYFLQDATQQNINSILKVLLTNNSLADNQFISQKLLVLYELYNRVNIMYNNNIDQFMQASKFAIRNDKDKRFIGFDQSSLLRDFYYLYRFLTKIFSGNKVSDLRYQRISECLSLVNIDRIVNNYDFYAHGFEKFSIKTKGSISSVIPLKDGRFATRQDRQINIYNPITGKIDINIENKNFDSMQLYMREDGNIVIPSQKVGGYILDISTTQLLKLENAEGKFTNFKMTKNDILIGGMENGTAIVWDLNTRKILFRLKDSHKRYIPGIIILPDNNVILWGQTNIMELWDTNNGTLKFSGNRAELLKFVPQYYYFLRVEMDSNLNEVKTLPDGKIIVTDNGGDLYFVKDYYNENPPFMKGVLKMDVLPNGNLLILRKNSLECWDLEIMQSLFYRKVKTGYTDKLVVLKNGHFIFVTDKTFTIWE